MVSAGGVSWLQQAEISPPLHPARCGARSLVDVGDATVAWVCRVGREGDATFDRLIRSGGAEPLAPQQRTPFTDLEFGHGHCTPPRLSCPGVSGSVLQRRLRADGLSLTLTPRA